MKLFESWRQRRTAWFDVHDAGIELDSLRWAWRRAAEGTGLGRRVDTVTGPTISVPTVERVEFGPPTRLVVRLLPGQLPADVVAAGGRIAPALGADRLRVQAHGHGRVVVELGHGDPLAEVLHSGDVPAVAGGVTFGRCEDGSMLAADPAVMPHLVVQGATTSGKSALLRWLLVSLAARADVRVIGSDPSGSLWRPWPADADRVTGLADPEAHVAMLERAVAELDRRLQDLPRDTDRVRTGPDLPLWFVVVEEWPGALRAADQVSKEVGRRLRSAMSRLLAEGHKAGFRVVMVVQRADATIVGGFERSNLGLRISFATDEAGLKMLHSAPDDVMDRHTAAPAGVCLLSGPDRPLLRLRAPWVEYSTYCSEIRGRGPR